MGICDSKKPPVQNKKPPVKNTNTIKNSNIPQPNINYRSKLSYSRNNSSTSYGFGNTSTKIQTVNNKNIMPESEYKKMTKYYYNLLTRKTINEGGQAKIVKEYSPKFKKTVVKKVIKINVSATASVRQKELLDKINLCKEAILLFKCDYPNVIKIYDFIEDPVTIVMEYCAKGSLRHILDKGFYLPPLYKIFLIYSICDGLGYIHTKGIVHGDLKCDNILLSDEHRYYIGNKYYPIPKLADFGLSQISPNKITAGTPGYIAPEVYEGSGLNFKTDIFALGMVMFEILSGLRPLPSDPELAMAFLAANKIPCTKEVLRVAWETRNEVLLPGIKNAYYDAFYTVMIKCIDDDPRKRPPISAIVIIVKKLYEIMLNVTRDLMDEESDDSFY